MKLLKKTIACLLCIFIVSMSFTACAEENKDNNPHNSVEAGNQIIDSVNDVPFITHQWDPYAYGEFYYNALGEQVKLDYERFVEAMMNGTTEIEVSHEFMEHIYDSIHVLFPAYYYVVNDMTYKDGVLSISYLDDRENTLQEFGTQIENIISSCVCEGDTDIEKAIALYNFLTPRLTYDYAAVGDIYADVSSYRGLMDYEGICQSFAGAYSYLCLQVGIDATVVVAVSDNLETHEWCMIKLDGEYYYVDPTFDCGMSSLKYFGFTKEYREKEDEYPIAWHDIGGLGIYRGDTFEGVTDNRFSDLNKINYDLLIKRQDQKMIVTGKSSLDELEYEFTI